MTRQDDIGAGHGPFDPKGFVRLGSGGKRPGARQVALVPGALVPVMALDLPAALAGAAREKVARRQVADLTGQTPDALDVRPFYGPGEARHWRNVLVADAETVAGWRAEAGAGCKAVLPDYLALPVAEGLWTLAVAEETLIARLGPGDGFSAPMPIAVALLQRAWDQADAAARPKLLYVIGAIPPEIAATAETLGIALEQDVAALTGQHGLSAPKALAHGELGFDLRRDPQAARQRLKARVMPWRWPVLAGLVAAGLWSLGQVLAIDRLQEQRDELAAASRVLVREHFVPQGPILDIRTQVARALAEKRRASGGPTQALGPLELFGRAAEVLSAEKARIGRVSYGVQQGLELTATVADFAALDRLTEALAARQMTVTVAGSRSVADGAEARLRLAAGGSGDGGGPDGEGKP